MAPTPWSVRSFLRSHCPDKLANFAKRLELDPVGAELDDQVVDLAHDVPPRSATMASIWVAQLGLPGDDLGDLGVEHLDVDGFAGVLGLDVGADGDVVAVLGDGLRVDELGEVLDVLARDEGVKDLLLVASVSLFLLPWRDELGGGVDEEHRVVLLATS